MVNGGNYNMNKKRVALALAAGLAVNSLVVTLGQVGGQGVIAHAQNARLTNPEGVTLAEVKTLETKVETVSQDTQGRDVVVVSFPGLVTNDIKGVTVTGNSVSGTWKDGKLTLTGLKEGINTITVKVSYNDTTKKDETYKITLKKTATQDQLSFNVTVGSATIDITGLKIGQTPITEGSVVLEKNGAVLGTQTIGTSTGTGSTGSSVKFLGIEGMKQGDVYDVVIKDKNSKEVTRGQFVLTPQAQPTVNWFYTNDTSSTGSTVNNTVSALASSLDTNFPGTITVTPENSELVVKKDNTKIGTLDQTIGTSSAYGGVGLKTESTTSGFKISIDTSADKKVNTSSTNQQNFIPNMRVDDIELNSKTTTTTATSTPSTDAHIGLYTLTFSGAGKTVSVSEDASAKLGTVSVGTTSSSSKQAFLVASGSGVVTFNGNSTDSGMLSRFNDQLNGKLTLGYDDLSQGYQSVSAEFTVRDNGIAGKSLDEWTKAMESAAKQSGAAVALTQEVVEENATSTVDAQLTGEVTAEVVTDENTTPAVETVAATEVEAKAPAAATSVVTTFSTPISGPVVTSVIFEVDKLDAQTVTGTFKKTGEKTGQLTIDGTGLFEPAINDLSQIAKFLTIDGASNIVYSGIGSKDSVTFDVTFSGNVPAEVKWSLGRDNNNRISNTFKTTAYEPVNANIKVVDNKQSSTGVYLDVTFTGLNIPNGSSVTLKDSKAKVIRTASVTDNKALISVDQFDVDLVTGDYTLTVTTSGTAPETYEVGVQVVKTPIGISITANSSSNTGVTVDIDAFLNGKDPSTIQSGKIQYREVGSTDAKWTDITLGKDDFKEDKITKSINGLTSGKEYDIRVVYNYKESANATAVDVYSNTVRVKVVSGSNSGSGNGTITGDGGSSTSGTSTGSTTITSTSSNTTYGDGRVNVKLSSSFKYDSGKTPVTAGVKYKDKDGKIVTENKDQYSGITARFENGEVIVEGLIPGKQYTELSIDYTDNNGRVKTLVLKDVKVDNGTDLQKYLANVYRVVFTREADETGYNFHLKRLSNKEVNLREFLLNLLSEKEFIENYKTPETKIEALYKAIVNRDSDTAGRDFWIAEYKKVLQVYGSEAAALQAIAERMVNENELKELAGKLGVNW